MHSYSLIALLAFVAVLWLLIALPQRRVRRRHAELIAALRVGQKVMTAGGLHGIVRGLEPDTIALEVAPGIEITVARGAIAAVLADEQGLGKGGAAGLDNDSDPASSS